MVTVYSFSIFGYKECNQSDFSIDCLVMSMCKVVLYCTLWKRETETGKDERKEDSANGTREIS